jgi:hemolysin activation/secretion protein
VYVPEQTLSDGVVELQVLEGRIGNVQLEVDPAVKVDPALMDRFIEILRGNPVAERELVERALFALGDLRGITTTSALTPGDKPGYADLTVKVGAGARVVLNADADNGGSIFTGRYRLGGSVDWLSPTGRGDSLSLKALASTNGGVAFARLAWLNPVGARGTKFGLAASALRYKLGSPVFEPLDATGTGFALSAQLLTPLIRSRNNNLFLQGSFDRRRFEDKVRAIDLVSRKRVTSYFTLGVVGDFRDTLGGGGISNYSANLIGGRLELDTPQDIATDEANYRSAGRYGKLVLTGARLQSLPNKDFLYLSALAQFASKDLDSSEKQSLGGPSGVRGYPSPDTPSDSALILGWEYRKPLAFDGYPGDWVLALFGDYGVGRQHESPLPTDTDNVRHLYSHGVGLTYGNYTGLLVKGWVAVRGDTEAQSDDSRARAYLQVTKQF